MGQARTARNTVPTTNSNIRSGGASAVVERPASLKTPPSAKSSSSAKTVTIPRDQIAKRAHEIWVKRGCKHGTDQQNWFEAEAQLKAELAGR